MADEPAVPVVLPRWVGLVTQIVAPATLVGALLFYFGYRYTQSYYWYFGLSVELIGLSTREVVERSPLPLFVPLVVLVVIAIAVVAARRWADARVAEASARGEDEARDVRRRAALVAAAGGALAASGLVLMLGARWFDDWLYYDLVTPLLVAAGGTLAALALRYSRASLRFATAGIWVLVAACTFWATATVADALGQGAARDLAADFSDLPAIVVVSPVDLHLTNTVAAPQDLCVARGASSPDPACVRAGGPRYRYVGMRVLVRGPDATFVVPGTWDPSGSTVRIPDSLGALVQYQFVCDPPSGWRGDPARCDAASAQVAAP